MVRRFPIWPFFLLGAAVAAPSGPVSSSLAFSAVDNLPRVIAIIPHDPLYGRELWASGPTVEAALKFTFPDLLEYAQAGYAVTFQRADGEGVTFKLADLIGSGAVLAVTDWEASGSGRMWMPVQVNGQTLRTPQIGTYLVWPGHPEKPAAWSITRIDLNPPK